MNRIYAEEIGRKARALKHCIKLLSNIDKKGSAEITLNCTGVKFVVHKGDALYLKLVTTKAQLEEDIGSYQIVEAASKENKPKTEKTSPTLSPEEKEILRKQKKAAYMREYFRKRREKNQENCNNHL